MILQNTWLAVNLFPYVTLSKNKQCDTYRLTALNSNTAFAYADMDCLGHLKVAFGSLKYTACRFANI